MKRRFLILISVVGVTLAGMTVWILAVHTDFDMLGLTLDSLKNVYNDIHIWAQSSLSKLDFNVLNLAVNMARLIFDIVKEVCKDRSRER